MTQGRAVVLGATGLVGSALVRQLLSDDSYERVVTLTRREIAPQGEKHEPRVIDFERPESWQHSVAGDVVFSALGTTLRAAGSKEAQFRVDHDYQLFCARAAKQNGVSSVVLISSTGADRRSLVFYSRMKGQLETEIRALGLPRFVALRPGILKGERQEKRAGEEFALKVLGALPPFSSLSKLRPVDVETVARAARAAATGPVGSLVLEAEEIFALGAHEGPVL